MPEAASVTTGDAVLDSVRQFLRAVSREYQDHLSRKPTLQELQYVLNLAFKANVDDQVVSGVEERDVRQVAINTARRPKRQKARPGDIFAFQLDDGRWGFGRIVSDCTIGAVAEFFDYTPGQPVFDYGKIDTWLIPPISISSHLLFEARIEGDWRIIGHTPGFAPGERYRDLRFVYGDPHWIAVGVFGISESVSAEVAGRHSLYASRGDRNVKNEIKRYLAGKPLYWTGN
ncbi:Imm26 family immunity protein [Massilia genomosp. 1]|uniref:Imm26 family immunity protein n=1 Tax=Massilia genomosp. 1 TaxID=2609280 RepID=UPI0014215BC2